MTGDARRAAEAAARSSYGRLVALVAAGARDLGAAEDALAEAFVAALRSWPEKGVPDNPEAWLLTVAQREVGRVRRHGGVRAAAADTLEMLYEAAGEQSGGLPDRRLELLFVCAHPAIDSAVRTPLMLQAVLGLDAARIAGAFLVAPAAMGQQLVRAKAKIKAAGIRFAEPDPEELAERLASVLDAIYAAYGTGWDALPGAEGSVSGLTAEAIFLARLVVSLLPGEPEAKGLLALMLYCEARAPARRDAAGGFVPLARQNPALWSRDAILEAEVLLREAAAAGQFGRFQCEAAIQSLHVERGISGASHAAALLALYDLLAQRAPSLGGLVAGAAVRAEAGDAAGALATLDALPAKRIESYQPYWVTRTLVLEKLCQDSAAAHAKALALTRDPAIRAHLIKR